MEKQIDARGELCPKPVIMTKKELDNLVEGTITTIVDNEVAKENLSKLADSMGLTYTIDKTKENEFYIHISKVELKREEFKIASQEPPKQTTIAIGSDVMGKGEEALGKILMKGFIYTVKETTPYPNTIVFYNSGVYLTCDGSPVLDDLAALIEEGVEIQSCGTCLDYYDLKDKLLVGGVSNMYSIYEKMKNANTINIG